MTKEELIQNIKNLHLEKEFEDMLLQAVYEAPQVDQALLDKVADLLDTQADFYEKVGESLQEQADIYENLEEELNTIDEEEESERTEAMLETQQELLSELDLKLKQITGDKQDTTQQDKIQQELQQMVQSGGVAIDPNLQQVTQPTLAPAPINPTAQTPTNLTSQTSPIQTPPTDPNLQQAAQPTQMPQPIPVQTVQPEAPIQPAVIQQPVQPPQSTQQQNLTPTLS